MGAQLKKAAGGMLGAAVGAAFSMASRGAMELDSALQTLIADTGMTAEEAKAASKAMTALYKDNLQGFDEIGAAMAKVHNDLGLVGDAATEATAAFLKFATATNQDAASAVADFDDILDAWNLTAEDTGALMDQLVASHQKYGGSITENQKTLATFAPQLRALGMDVNDGIALLNLFAVSGLDSSKAMFALNTAVKNIKPGETFDDLVAKIVAIEDPTKRAQAAIELFGARGGVSLANVLRPGITGLGDFAIAATDVTTATEDAASAIEDSMGNRLKLVLKQLQGTLTEIGTSVGDLVIVFALLGPKIMAGIGGAVGLLATTIGPKIAAQILALTGFTVPAATAAGEATGAAMAAGAATGLKAGLARLLPLAVAASPAVVIGVLLVAKGPLADFLGFGEKGSDQMGGAFKTPYSGPGVVVPVTVSPDEEKSVAAFREFLASLPENAPKPDYSEWVASGLKTALPAAKDGGKAVGESVKTGIQWAWQGPLDPRPLIEKFGMSLRGVGKAAREGGAAAMVEMATGISLYRQKPLDAFDTLKQMLKTAMSTMGEISRLYGNLASKELAAGLKSGDPAVRAQAQAVLKMTTDRLQEIAGHAGPAGEAAMQKLRAGMRSKIPEVRAASLAARNAALQHLGATKPATVKGAALGSAFGTAVGRGINTALSTFKYKWPTGKGVVSIGFQQRLASGGPVTAGMPYVVGDAGRPEWFVPETSGYVYPEVPAGAGTGGGITVNVPIQSFYGTAQNITDLSRAIGQQVRLATVKGTA